MTEVLALLIALPPYIGAALFFGLFVALSARWFLTNPQRWFFYAVLLFSLPAMLGGSDSTDGSLVKQLTWGGLFAIAGLEVFGLTRGQFAWPKNKYPPAILIVLILYALVSVAWSPYPMVSAKRAAQIVGVLLLAMVVASHAKDNVGLRSQLLGPVVLFLFLGLLAAIFSPGMAFDGNSLRAITSHKNTWGQFSLLACLVILFSISSQGLNKWPMIGLLAAAVVSLLLSRSTTSILAFVLILGLVMTYLMARSGSAGIIALFSIAVIVGVAVLVFTMVMGELPSDWAYESVFRITDKTQTLTGRSFLWQLMFAEIERHKWLGIGFGGFWMGLDGPSAPIIARLNWGPPSQAHSGFIDVANELGMVGIGLLALLIVFHARKLLTLWSESSQREMAFHSALLVAALVINYAETSLLRTTHLWWVVLCASIVEIHFRFGKMKKATEK